MCANCNLQLAHNSVTSLSVMWTLRLGSHESNALTLLSSFLFDLAMNEVICGPVPLSITFLLLLVSFSFFEKRQCRCKHIAQKQLNKVLQIFMNVKNLLKFTIFKEFWNLKSRILELCSQSCWQTGCVLIKCYIKRHCFESSLTEGLSRLVLCREFQYRYKIQ